MQTIIDYARGMQANQEVLTWCSTVLAAANRKHTLDQTEMEHVIDYLVSDAAPKRLRKASYKQMLEAAEKWSKAQQKRGRNLTDGPEDIRVIHDFLDGTKIVQLLTKKAYEREGYLMRHCVGGYNPDSTTIYSYRDARNEPHATFEVTTDSSKRINQIKGKGNGAIHPKYINPILAFLQTLEIKIRPHDMRNLGYLHITPKVQEVLAVFQLNDVRKVQLLGEEYLVI